MNTDVLFLIPAIFIIGFAVCFLINRLMPGYEESKRLKAHDDEYFSRVAYVTLIGCIITGIIMLLLILIINNI